MRDAPNVCSINSRTKSSGYSFSSFSFANLDLDNATNHAQIWCGHLSKKIITIIY